MAQDTAARADPGCDSAAATLVIRRATVADALAISGLYAREALLQERLDGYPLTPGFDWARWVAARLAAPGHCVWVAERGCGVLAYIHARLRSPPGRAESSGTRAWATRVARTLLRRPKVPPVAPGRLEGWAIIESLYVRETERRRGLGSRLVAAARDDLAAMGAARVEISVMVANEAAVAFWSRLGFQPFRAHMAMRIAPSGEVATPP